MRGRPLERGKAKFRLERKEDFVKQVERKKVSRSSISVSKGLLTYNAIGV